MGKKRKESNNIFKKIFEGRIIDGTFLAHNWKLIAVFLGVTLGYISCKYHYQSQIDEIDRLQRTLQNVTTDYVSNSSKYNSSSRESQLDKYMAKMNITLHSSDTPPYNLK